MNRAAWLVVLCLAAPPAGAAPAADPDTHVVLLGTGTPNPAPDRQGPSLAVVSGGRAYLVDCGTGVVRRAVQAGIRAEDLDRLFVTHLHSDHTLGYPDVILTPGVMGRGEPLLVFGPKGLKAMTARILEAWKEDLEVRWHGGEPSRPASYAVRPVEIGPGEVYRDENVRVIAFPVSHGAWGEEAYAYRFEARDKVVVVSGDTTYDERMATFAKGADLLVHEVYCEAGWRNRTPEWQRYHAAYHTSGPDLGCLAAKVRPRTLVLTHQLLMGAPREKLLEEIRSAWQGEIVDGKDLDVIR
jgi:ribonuclease BN (tRNA processing enzyme)